MACLDDRSDKTRYADAVAAHHRGDHLPIRPRNLQAHGGRIFVAEIKDVADLDASPSPLAIFGDRRPTRLIVSFVGRRIGRTHAVEERLQALGVAILKIVLLPVELLERRIIEDFALARRCENDELMGKIAADRSGGRLHRNSLDTHPLERPQIG